jgi:hypothetical protein
MSAVTTGAAAKLNSLLDGGSGGSGNGSGSGLPDGPSDDGNGWHDAC